MTECCKRTNILATGCGSHRSGGVGGKRACDVKCFLWTGLFHVQEMRLLNAVLLYFWNQRLCVFGAKSLVR